MARFQVDGSSEWAESICKAPSSHPTMKRPSASCKAAQGQAPVFQTLRSSPLLLHSLAVSSAPVDWTEPSTKVDSESTAP